MKNRRVSRKRFRKVMGLFLKIFWAFFSLRWKRLWHSKQWLGKSREELYVLEARRFKNAAVEMGGLLIKLGQFFSTRVDIFPSYVVHELEGLQDEVRPVEWQDIRQVIEEEFRRSVGDIYKNVEEAPLAAASLGQVHRGTLSDGTEVAIKVLRPGIEELVRVDLNALELVIRLLKRFTDWGKMFDLDLIFKEFSETVWKELDYIQEGHNAETIANNTKDNKDVLFPDIYWDYTTRRVLTMAFMKGIKISRYDELDRLGVDRKKLGRLLISVYCQQILTDGFFHADPHPGNLFVREDGKLIMVDFGMVGAISEELKGQLLELAVHVVQKQYIEVTEDLKKMGFLRSYADNNVVSRLLAAVIERFLGDGKKMGDAAFMGLLDDIEVLVYEQPFQIPGNYTFLGRAAGTLYGLCLGIDPEINFLDAIKPYVNDFIGGKKRVFDKVKEEGEALLRSAVMIPSLAAKVLQQADQGELTVRVPLHSLLESTRDNTAALRMLSWAVVFGFLLLSSTYLLAHALFQWAYGGFGFSFLAFLVMLRQRPSAKRVRHPSMVPRGRK